MGFTGTVFILIAVAIVFIKSHEVPNQHAKEESAGMAIVLCEMHAKNVLKSPRSAKFPWAKKAVFDGELAILKSYVDAQNSFGAMIRTNYICTVRYLGGDPDEPSSWKIEEFLTE